MAEGLNRATLLGNIGADPELRATAGGQSILKFSVATTERFKNATDEWEDRTEWHRVVVWGKRGEGLHKILAKGDRIYVEGTIRTSKYEKNGADHWSTDIIARQVLLCGSKGGRPDPVQHPVDRRAPRPAAGAAPGAAAPGGPPPGSQDDFGYDPGGGGDDEIPF